jgi:aminobenzoyl-glutamate utilization protein B
MSIKTDILEYLNKKEGLLSNLAKDIWDHPQVALNETYASNKIINFLEEEGFSISKNIGNISTSFVASYGKGSPIIGILGEYDALPGLSQKVSNKKEPINYGQPGHGCGHNLLGVGSLGSAVTIKEMMKNNRIKGTVRYYGCPAEETLVGKVFMAKAGVFDDLDASLCWHPMNVNTIWDCSSLALNSFKINFHGVAAHAASDPDKGLSALDGVILTDIGVNYLREHVLQEARIHSVITNGGSVPNVVPDYAQIWYFIRAPHRNQVEKIYSKVLDISKGAAMMTGTTVNVEFITGCYEYLPNDTIGKTIYENLLKVGPPDFTNEERNFAQELEATMPADSFRTILKSYDLTQEEVGRFLSDKIIVKDKGPLSKGKIMAGSTDVGDVSFITPTAQFGTTCWPISLPEHSWQTTASSGSTIGFKGMLVAAKTLALTVYDLLTEPNILKEAREEFKKAINGGKYISPLLKR